MQESDVAQELQDKLHSVLLSTERLHDLLHNRNSDTLSEDIAELYQGRQGDIDYIASNRAAIEAFSAPARDQWSKSFARLQQLDTAVLEKLNELRTTTQKKLLSVSKRRVLLKYSS